MIANLLAHQSSFGFSQQREPNSLGRKEIYVFSAKNLSDDQEELKNICQKYSGMTMPLTYMREKLRVKEFVQLLNCFPFSLKPQVSIQDIGEASAKSDEFVENHKILIYFDVNDDDSVSQNSLTESSSVSSDEEVESPSFVTSSEISEESDDGFQRGSSTFCIKKDSFDLLNDMRKARALRSEKSLVCLVHNDVMESSPKLDPKLRTETIATAAKTLPEEEKLKSPNALKFLNIRNVLVLSSVIVVSTFIAIKFSYWNVK